MELHERVTVFAEDFAFCTKILTALGDETRQYLILEMLKSNRCGGVRKQALRLRHGYNG